MSVDINWDALTAGPEGERRAERIRSFVHDKFQLVPFPKFIKSVNVHSFSFGSIPPNIELRDICDPYAEFYEQDEDMSDSDSEEEDEYDDEKLLKLERERRRRQRKQDDSTVAGRTNGTHHPPPYISELETSRGAQGGPGMFPGRVGVTGVNTPLFTPIPSSANISNLHYFHSALSSGFTPNSHASALSTHQSPPFHQRTNSQATSLPSPPSTGVSSESGPSGFINPGSSASAENADNHEEHISRTPSPVSRLRERRDEDTQIIVRVRYTGDIRLEITAELLLEYPVTNFVVLPVRLVVTGCTFDGLACIAYIRRRAHFCFLEEDPEGRRDEIQETSTTGRSLLKHIHIESEIGEKAKGRQVLKNVGKIERFVLEQVRRIFEEEFVFPSSWTFLV